MIHRFRHSKRVEQEFQTQKTNAVYAISLGVEVKKKPKDNNPVLGSCEKFYTYRIEGSGIADIDETLSWLDIIV